MHRTEHHHHDDETIMGDLTHKDFYDAIQKLHDQINERHTSLRVSMEAGFSRLDVKLDQHASDDAKVESRVTIIETERREEAKLAIKRGTWAGILAAFGLTALWELLKSWKA